ncbi:MAG: electron transport complex subunit RsxE [bacterium]
MSLKKEFTKGCFKQNPVFALILGLCPVLAVSNSVENAIGMGFAATFVLLCSNIIISIFRKQIPDKVRIPSYIVVIATFVTIAGMILEAYLPSINKSLGIFVPLIVVNCIILGRAESFASKNNVLKSIMDGLGMGVGFTLALLLIAFIRELFGTGKIMFLGNTIIPQFIPSPALIFILPPGALLTMGLLLAFFSYKQNRKMELNHACGSGVCINVKEEKEKIDD